MVSTLFTFQIIQKIYIIETSNTVCLTKSISNDQMNPQLTQILSQHIVSALCTGQIIKQSY